MLQYRSEKVTGPELKAVKQMENESLKDFYRRARCLGDLDISEKSHTKKKIKKYMIKFWMDSSTSGCNKNFMKTKRTAIFAKCSTGPNN